MKKSGVGKSSSGNFKMPGAMREADVVPGHGSKNSYPGKGNTMLQTWKNSQRTTKFAPGTPQTPNNVAGSGSKTSYPKRSLPSNGSPMGGVLKSPPSGMSPKCC